MLASLLHALKILTETGVDVVGNQLAPLSITDAALSVEEPLGDTVFNRLLDDVGDLLDLLFGHLTGAFGVINLGDAEDQVRKTATKTLDDTETESGLLLSIDVGVLHTQNVLEISGVL